MEKLTWPGQDSKTQVSGIQVMQEASNILNENSDSLSNMFGENAEDGP